MQKLYLNPVSDCIDKLNSTAENRVFLYGLPGSGKTVVLNEFEKDLHSKNIQALNATKTFDELNIIENKRLFKLYEICLLIKKIQAYIVNVYGDYVNEELIFFLKRIDNYLRQISYIYYVKDFKNLDSIFPSAILNNPETLLEYYLSHLDSRFGIKDIIIILDSFDKGTSKTYQEIYYEVISTYLKTIMSISDENYEDKVGEKTDVVKVNYNENVDVMFEIIDRFIITNNLHKGDFSKRIRFLLDSKDMALLIEKTNGNLFDILRAVRFIYTKTSIISPSFFKNVLFTYIDEEINKPQVITGMVVPKRKLL